ncbi:TPA: hypothetical protein LU109_003579 [Enterobacter hormaechei subsp. xiangfangensis]|nr:hypothetical protein [Enterobacter hormaechei subsp. xiangfangensis]
MAAVKRVWLVRSVATALKAPSLSELVESHIEEMTVVRAGKGGMHLADDRHAEPRFFKAAHHSFCETREEAARDLIFRVMQVAEDLHKRKASWMELADNLVEYVNKKRA